MIAWTITICIFRLKCSIHFYWSDYRIPWNFVGCRMVGWSGKAICTTKCVTTARKKWCRCEGEKCPARSAFCSRCFRRRYKTLHREFIKAHFFLLVFHEENSCTIDFFCPNEYIRIKHGNFSTKHTQCARRCTVRQKMRYTALFF